MIINSENIFEIVFYLFLLPTVQQSNTYIKVTDFYLVTQI